MGRKSIWKNFTFRNPNEYRRLRANLSGLPEAKSYEFNFNSASYTIETNLPYSSLRAWFRYSDVPIRDHVTDTMTLDERVKEWEKEEQEKMAKQKTEKPQMKIDRSGRIIELNGSATALWIANAEYRKQVVMRAYNLSDEQEELTYCIYGEGYEKEIAAVSCAMVEAQIYVPENAEQIEF